MKGSLILDNIKLILDEKLISKKVEGFPFYFRVCRVSKSVVFFSLSLFHSKYIN